MLRVWTYTASSLSYSRLRCFIPPAFKYLRVLGRIKSVNLLSEMSSTSRFLNLLVITVSREESVKSFLAMWSSVSWRHGFFYRDSSIISKLSSLSLHPFIFKTFRLLLQLKNSEKARAPSVSKKFSERFRNSIYPTDAKRAFVDMHKSDLGLYLRVSLVSRLLRLLNFESMLSAK